MSTSVLKRGVVCLLPAPEARRAGPCPAASSPFGDAGPMQTSVAVARR